MVVKRERRIGFEGRFFLTRILACRARLSKRALYARFVTIYLFRQLWYRIAKAMINPSMNFCSDCGEKVSLSIPDGDNVPRYVCDACGTIHYQNPKMVVGCIPEWGDQILLCRRAIEPRYGLWTLPAGFMENGETAAAGAARETLEEAGARVTIDQLYTFLNLPNINQIYVMFRGTMLDLDFAAGTESLEVKLFGEAEIPWKELAFRTIKVTLEKYFEDRKNGSFGFHMGDILPPNR